jgi:aryl-alcohol dehydrogenase-like predicted oxidoreductase
LAHSVLAYGLLAGSFTDSREFYPPDHRAERWNPEDLKERIAQVGALRAVMGGPLPTLRSVALRFVLSQDRVSSAVLGPRNMQQLDQLIRDAGRAPPYMSAETFGDLERALEAYGVTGE